MKTMYIECAMGAAGDMLMAALADLLPNPDAFVEKMNALSLPGVHLHLDKSVKCGITGRSVSVHVHGREEESHDAHRHRHEGSAHEHGQAHGHLHGHDHGRHHEHGHRGPHDIGRIIDGLVVSDAVKQNAHAVYRLIADAESHVHGVPVTQIHFHEVGALDAVADVVGVCLLMEMLSPDRVVVSPVHVGSGQVRCAHGILPVPAPATAHILRGVPSYGGETRGELCTPTGAALLKRFAAAFGPMPVMAVEAIGYGMGKKDFPAANCVRVMLGSSETREGPNGETVLLCCNLDDATGEEMGFAQEMLMSRGALDVFVAPVQMKKNRPGHLLSCMCKPEDADRLAKMMLAHTPTFGVRRLNMPRYMLSPEISNIETPYGAIRLKTGRGYGIEKSKLEYEDVKAAAQAHGVPMETVRKSAPGATVVMGSRAEGP